MPRKKAKGPVILKKTSYFRPGSAKMAADVDISCILDYLCDAGPGLCSRCPSRCAYGLRYLDEVLGIEGKEKT